MEKKEDLDGLNGKEHNLLNFTITEKMKLQFLETINQVIGKDDVTYRNIS